MPLTRALTAKNSTARTPTQSAALPTPFATFWGVIGARTVEESTASTAPPYGTFGTGGSVASGRPVGGGGWAGGGAGVLMGGVCSTRRWWRGREWAPDQQARWSGARVGGLPRGGQSFIRVRTVTRTLPTRTMV